MIHVRIGIIAIDITLYYFLSFIGIPVIFTAGTTGLLSNL